jgi:hypothetical protein
MAAWAGLSDNALSQRLKNVTTAVIRVSMVSAYW